MAKRIIEVTSRIDGRGGAYVAKAYTDKAGVYHSAKEASQKYVGEKVRIANFDATVTSDGRINIPKRIMDAVGSKNSAGRRTVNVQFGGRGSKIGARIERPGIVEQVKQAMAGKGPMPEPRRFTPSGGGGGGGYGGLDDEGEDIEDYDFGGSSGLDDESIEMDWGDYDYDIIDPGDDGDFYFDD